MAIDTNVIAQTVLASHLLIPILGFLFIGCINERRRLIRERVKLLRTMMVAKGSRRRRF